MQHTTSFFQGFSSILFGRPALSGVRITLRKIAALNTLSEFFQTFGFLIPDALLRRRSSGANSRERRFTLHVTFWAFLAQTLAPQTSCRDIVRKVQAWWLLRTPGPVAGSSSTAAYTKARQRLGPEIIRGIGNHLVARLEGRVQASQLWLGRRVRMVNGTTVSMPDTPENQEKYPQSSSQKAGCGFPQMRVVGLFSLASGALLEHAEGNTSVHESMLFGQLMSYLEHGYIVPGDPNCAFYWKCLYHLHYIYDHNGCNFAHVTSRDMVHWTWQPTSLKQETVGHGMFSGTGFITKDGMPSVIYHGAGSGRN